MNSYPDYKNLLQENYCTWNTNIDNRTHWAFSFIDAILTLAGYATVT